jgi:hypothetical protein
MKRFVVCLGLGLILIFVPADGSAQNYKKLAQSGMEFLNVKSDAKAMAMAGAVTALDMGSGSLFFNPAGMANMKSRADVSFSLNKWIADISQEITAAVNRRVEDTASRLRFRASITAICRPWWIWGRIKYRDRNFSPSALSVGLGYAKSLSDRFSVGGQVHWIRQQLGENSLPVGVDSLANRKNEVTPVSYDFGTIFKTGFKSLAFGMSVRNFSKEIKFSKEGFQLPLSFTMGVSADLLDWIGTGGVDQSLVAAVDAVHYRSRPSR